MENLIQSFCTLLDDAGTDERKCRMPKKEKQAVRLEKLHKSRIERRKIEHQRRRQQKKFINEASKSNLPNKLKIIIDFSFDDYMTEKELAKLARQLMRVWGLQKQFEGLNVTICNPSENFLNIARQKVTGFDGFGWNVTKEAFYESGEKTQFVFLSPDASNPPLMDLDPNKCYVIGGLVDETGVGSVTNAKAESLSCETYRLPIKEYGRKLDTGTFNVMLTINQVVEALTRFAVTKNWSSTLSAVVPKRCGYTFDTHDVNKFLNSGALDDGNFSQMFAYGSGNVGSQIQSESLSMIRWLVAFCTILPNTYGRNILTFKNVYLVNKLSSPGCTITENTILECDGSERYLTPTDIRALAEYRDRMRKWDRTLKTIVEEARDDEPVVVPEFPTFPRICKRCLG